MVARIDMLGGSGEQEARDDDVDGLGEDLLPHAERSTRVELALIEVGGLLELEELFGLPSQPVELGDLCPREVRPTQRGEVERLVAVRVRQLDGAQLDGLGATPCVVAGGSMTR